MLGCSFRPWPAGPGKWFFGVAGLLLCMVAGAQAVAASSARVDRIKQQIRSAVHAQAAGHQVSVGSLSALAEMKPCSARLALQLYGQGRYRNVRLSCPTRGWQLYVPVTLSSARPIVVAAHDLQAGVILNASDIKTRKSASAQGDGGAFAHERKAVIGHTLRAPVSSGTPISLSSLSQPIRVHAGQMVTVEVRADAIRIKTSAVALQDGRVGQSILVKNPDSGHRYRVQVTAHGVIDDLSG